MHHCFPGTLRNKSEQYGLVVPLCGNRCHRLGKYAVHQNRETARALKAWAQEKCMTEQGWSMEDWHREFGKSYIEEKYTLSQLSSKLGISQSALFYRVSHGWSEKELSLPVSLNNKNIRGGKYA